MDKTENIKDFYSRKMNFMPDSLSREIGHFNVFRVAEFTGNKAKIVPFNRKDFYKITLAIGKNRYSYADKVIEIDRPALVFTNPMIPYKCERLSEQQEGYFCIFTAAFFTNFGNIKQYPVFEPNQIHIYYPSEIEVEDLKAFYEQLFIEIGSEYSFKYDLIRAQLLQFILRSAKMVPVLAETDRDKNANTRIASLFIELLERQFPIESSLQKVKLRLPSEFAVQLSVHVNHLNRALKLVTGKTTSQLIAGRVAQEATVLLKHTDWTVSEIGYSLGFDEPSHFISFFRKQLDHTPNYYRKEVIV